MNKECINEFKNKRILIWGMGREGKSTRDFLLRNNLTNSIEVFEGERSGFDIDNYDYIFKSPGIPYIKKEDKIISQTEVFLKAYRNQVIGITGTKGKSTTSAMMYYALKGISNVDAVFLGNIGIPPLDYYDKIKENTIVVFEMSCHQLNNIRYSPHIAVFLNLFEDHLDYYKTKKNYFEAKKGISAFQKKDDYLIVGPSVPYFDTDADIIEITDEKKIKLSIKGDHNNFNANVVKKVLVDILGFEEQKVLDLLYQFAGLPHRMEYIGTYDGVQYFDDSISTIPEATINAIDSLDNIGSVIIGGMDRNIDYSKLHRIIHKRDDILFILMYASGKRIYSEDKNLNNVTYVGTLHDAVKIAKEKTLKGKACLLSPAAASYDSFRNFEERGDCFKKYVEGL